MFTTLLVVFIISVLRLVTLAFDIYVANGESGMAQGILFSCLAAISFLYLAGYGIGKWVGSHKTGIVIGTVLFGVGLIYVWWEIFDGKAMIEVVNFIVELPPNYQGPLIFIDDGKGQIPQQKSFSTFQVKSTEKGVLNIKAVFKMGKRMPRAEGVLAGGRKVPINVYLKSYFPCKGQSKDFYGAHTLPPGQVYDEKSRQKADQYFNQIEKAGVPGFCN